MSEYFKQIAENTCVFDFIFSLCTKVLLLCGGQALFTKTTTLHYHKLRPPQVLLDITLGRGKGGIFVSVPHSSTGVSISYSERRTYWTVTLSICLQSGHFTKTLLQALPSLTLTMIMTRTQTKAFPTVWLPSYGTLHRSVERQLLNFIFAVLVHKCVLCALNL